MVAIRTRFDGKQIEVPKELIEAGSADVIVLFEGANPNNATPQSIWDVCGKASNLRTAADIDAQIREERDGWGDR
jgi:hypothetical protein